MKALKLLISVCVLVLLSGTVSAQLTITSTGRTVLNGLDGVYNNTPYIYINSNDQNILGINSGLTLVNSDNTLNNSVRLNFSSRMEYPTGISGWGLPDRAYACITTQFINKGWLAGGAADFHISTFSKGVLAPKFSIYHSVDNANYSRFLFKAGEGDIWFDNSGEFGDATIRPSANSSGSIGTSSEYWCNLYVDNAYVGNHPSVGSDKRIKNNIKEIDNGTLSKIAQVRGVKYKLNLPFEKAKSTEKVEIDTNYTYETVGWEPSEEDNDTEYLTAKAKEDEIQKKREKEHFGFIAQELIEIFPEVVNYNKEEDAYSIQYTALIPVLFEGIKEQQAIIDAQSLKLKELETKLANLIKADGKIINATLSPLDDKEMESKAEVESNALTNAFLYQNVPNPFSTNTEIKYFIPEGVKDAKLFIFSIQGNLLKTEKISTRGQGSIVINGTALTAGIYLYSLVLEGKEVDTKRMILTE